MPISDLDCANLCLSQYNGEDIFDRTFCVGGDVVSVKNYPDCTAVIHEGSHDAPNWINNFDAVMQQIDDFGGVEQGFYVNLPAMMVSLQPLLDKSKPIYVVGHSRGAARAHICGAMLIKRGYNVEVVTFGSPRPGDAVLSAVLASAPNRSYFNYHSIDEQDYVCDVPLDLTLVSPFVHPAARIKIDVAPEPGDPWLLLARHHVQLYIKGLESASNPNNSST